MIKILEGNLAAYSGTKEETVTREQEHTDSPKVRANEDLTNNCKENQTQQVERSDLQLRQRSSTLRLRNETELRKKEVKSDDDNQTLIMSTDQHAFESFGGNFDLFDYAENHAKQRKLSHQSSFNTTMSEIYERKEAAQSKKVSVLITKSRITAAENPPKLNLRLNKDLSNYYSAAQDAIR